MKNDNAFTLVEILVVLLIFSVISAVIAGGILFGHRIKASQEGIIEIQQNVRVAMAMLSRDIRMAGYELDPRWDLSKSRTLNSITTGTVDLQGKTCPNNSDTLEIKYIVSISGVGETTATVTYYLEDTNFMRRYQNPSEPDTDNQDRKDLIATNIDAIWVTYLVSNGSTTVSWSSSPANPSSSNTSNTPVTRAVGITLIGGSTLRNQDFNAAQTFTEPNVGNQTVTFQNQIDHRMYSTVVELNNINSEL
jgi:prepilin-type N-terminal cleavage/methylation domain-containing protein